jgi:hypothetical protein
MDQIRSWFNYKPQTPHVKTALAVLFSSPKNSKIVKDEGTKELIERFKDTTAWPHTLAYLIESISRLPFLPNNSDDTSLLAQPPQTVDQQFQSPFFRLPPEIRLLIYEELCKDTRLNLTLQQGPRPSQSLTSAQPTRPGKFKVINNGASVVQSPWRWATSVGLPADLPASNEDLAAWMSTRPNNPMGHHFCATNHPAHGKALGLADRTQDARPLSLPESNYYDAAENFQALRNFGRASRLAHCETYPLLISCSEVCLRQWDSKLLPLLPTLLPGDLMRCVRALEVDVGWTEFPECPHSTLWWWRCEVERVHYWREIDSWRPAVESIVENFPHLRRLCLNYRPTEELPGCYDQELACMFLDPVDQLARAYARRRGVGPLKMCVVTVRKREFWERLKDWSAVESEEAVCFYKRDRHERWDKSMRAFWRGVVDAGSVGCPGGYWVLGVWKDMDEE